MSDTKPESLPGAAGAADVLAVEAIRPTAEPPVSALAAAGAGGVAATVWVNGKKINALWAINENRNSWVSVAGVGWVKLANNSDSAIVALTMLGADAKLTQGTVNYRQEADNMIHEMYVW
jgi:hypothetical protein